jgi:membrane-bound lytic murein transglycosylase B
VKRFLLLLCIALFFSGHSSAAPSKPLRPEVKVFIREMAQKHHFDARALRRIFSQVNSQPEVIQAVAAPAKPWSEYRALFINPERIAGGVKFWDEHEKVLARAKWKYEVPEEIIVATIGIESRYGRNTGRYRVLDALTTLAFDYAPRADFFKSELEEYLLLTRDAHINPLSLKGSYAGAMGIPQFIPSVYRRYAVDFERNGKTNLWQSPADAVGSIANYYHVYGWRMDEPIAVEATVSGSGFQPLIDKGIKPYTPVADLPRYGITPMQEILGENLVSLFALGEGDQAQYWLALNNFYVITRYNHNVYYAMAVYELSREIRSARELRSAVHQ